MRNDREEPLFFAIFREPALCCKPALAGRDAAARAQPAARRYRAHKGAAC